MKHPCHHESSVWRSMRRLGLLGSAFSCFSSQQETIWISQSCRRKRHTSNGPNSSSTWWGQPQKPCKLINEKKVFCCKAPRPGDYLIDKIIIEKITDGYAIISFAWTALPRPLF
ncbi:mCG53948 [Mus musculus]|uniref:Uncharacterized protein n=1 Tax=Mus musculus TaxID=10090 RepID=Q8BT22_MOUSE|nr:mCG53948 [Mus musculus]BAC25709.1 unnamed protein product [Mus musculus]